MIKRTMLMMMGPLLLVACTDGPPQWEEGAKLAAAEVGGTHVELRWTIPTDKDGLSGFRIKSASETLGEVGAGNDSFKVENLAGNTDYSFTVEASDMKGNWSIPLAVAVKTQDASPPTWGEAELEIDVSSRGALGSQVTFTWPAASDDVGVTQYKLTTVDMEPEEIGVTAGETEFVYQSIDVDGVYQIQAGDAAGNWSEDGPKVRVWANKGLKSLLRKQGLMRSDGLLQGTQAPKFQLR